MKKRRVYFKVKCDLCPVECGIDREKSFGYCGAKGLNIAKYYLHPYEEPPISFKNGSGAIFFTGCSLKCVFCQNYELSRSERGKNVTPRELADIFRELEEMGAENINLVTPTHFTDLIIEAFNVYKPKIPVVYNTSGYEKTDTLKRIDKYVDIYLPDIKFYSPQLSKRYTGREDYFERASEAILFMSKKQNVFSDNGKMLSGMIIRHLIMPLGVSDSVAILRWIKENLSEKTYLSLMSQYVPFGNIEKFPELKRRITKREYDLVLSEAVSLGFENVFLQDKSSAEKDFIPSWDF